MGIYRELPKSKNDMQFDSAPPAYTAWASQSGNPTASSVITLSDKTTIIEITAISGTAGSGGLIGRWGSASVTSSVFDIFIPVGGSRQFAVPVSVFGTASIAGANVANGLYPTLSVMKATAVATSIFSVEY